MIYDKLLTIYDLAPAASPLLRRLKPARAHFYAEKEVYAARFYQGKQAGVKLSRMVEIPRSAFDEPIEADQYCRLADGHMYRIDQAQRGVDGQGLPITTLSLAEPEGKYEILEDQGGA